MTLFDVDVPNANQGYLNIRDATTQPAIGLKARLDVLWSIYQPYADTDFQIAFALQPDEKFWEMYLTVQLLRLKKKIRQRMEIEAATDRNTGPDICIRKGKRKIWIEAIAPQVGDENINALPNQDRVPDLLFNESIENVPGDIRRTIELRITSALLKKRRAYEIYRESGIIGDNDSYIIAISAAYFPLQAVMHGGVPFAVTAVYPLGQHHDVFNAQTLQFVGREFERSTTIERKNPGESVARTAFQHSAYSGVSGLIWSRRSIGNFSIAQPPDFIFVHNSVARRPIRRRWTRWMEEYISINEGKQLKVRVNKKLKRRVG